MGSNEDILPIFKQKFEELLLIASEIPMGQKLQAKEFLKTNLKSLEDLLNNDTASNSAIQENIPCNKNSLGESVKINTIRNAALVIESSVEGLCPLKDAQQDSVEKSPDICDQHKVFETDYCSTMFVRKEDLNESFEGASVYSEDCNMSTVIPNSETEVVMYQEVKHPCDEVLKTNSETDITVGTIALEETKKIGIQNQDMIGEVNTRLLQHSSNMTQDTSETIMSQNELLSSPINYSSTIDTQVPQRDRNVIADNEATSSQKYVVISMEVDDVTSQGLNLFNGCGEGKETNDDKLIAESVTSSQTEINCTENPSTIQREPAIIRMNLRDKANVDHKPKGPGRPKNDSIPKPEYNSNGEPVYICEICKAAVKTYHALLVHTRIHTGSRPFCCNICMKSFTTKGNLKAHSVTHSDDKPWKCEFCSKTFKEKKVLKTHERIHTGEKPFSCTICNRAFNQRSALMEHVLTHSNNKPHLCDICGQGFRGASSLKYHKKRHSGTKEFTCNICNKAFVSKNELARHDLTHSGIRPFSCQLCQKSFTRLTNLKEHMNLHTGNRPFLCLDCGDTFSESASLSRHRKKHKLMVDSKTDLDSSVKFEFVQNPSYVGINPEQDSHYVSTLSEQTVFNDGDTLIQVLSDETSKIEYLQKLRSVLISASGNDIMANTDSSKQLYQILCVNPDTQEIVSQGEGHQVIVEGHTDDTPCYEYSI
ncbi:hypothetical protein ACF0H5_015064 [Mactra antiquata]